MIIMKFSNHKVKFQVLMAANVCGNEFVNEYFIYIYSRCVIYTFTDIGVRDQKYLETTVVEIYLRFRGAFASINALM
jgi:hypothetical protein